MLCRRLVFNIVRATSAMFVAANLQFASADVLTWHNDNARTGQNLNETILKPSNVNSTTFGKLFSLGVDGKVDAQPLYISNVNLSGGTTSATRNLVIVATEHDSVYAFDADDGTPVWHRSLLPTGETPSDDRGCGQVTPEIGITATPVIDFGAFSHGAIYVITMSKDGSGNYFQRLHALNLLNGAELAAGPVEILATYPGTGDNSSGGQVVFDPKQYKSRPGLVVHGQTVYTSWGSHCDIRPYTGWMIAYDKTTLAQTAVLNFTPNGTHGALWNSGAAPAMDANGNFFALVADGTFETTLDAKGFPNQHDFGNCFVKISQSGSTLAVSDYFTMYNTESESDNDQDLGSGGALVLPDMKDASGTVRHLAVGAGKDAHIYIVNRDNLGKFVPSATSNSYVYQDVNGELAAGAWSSPAYFNGRLYYGAVGDHLKAFDFSKARLVPTPQSQSTMTFPYPGTTPSISADGKADGIVWAAFNGSSAGLYAFDANDVSHQLYSSNDAPNDRDSFGAGNKFIVPTVANGKVYVGTTNSVGVFGLFDPPRPGNISTRANVGTGENALIGGFLLRGTGQRQLLIRALGPSLAVNGTPVAGRLMDPTLTLNQGSTVIASNDNWEDSPQKAQIVATGIAPNDPHESAILSNLSAGNFTAVVRGVNGSTGIGLVEIYEITKSSTERLSNLSSRGFVGTGNNALIGGVIASGTGPAKLLFRAIGPDLARAGVTNALADPTLELHDANGTLVSSNDNWQQSADASEISATGIAPNDPHDSAIIATLPTANYTAIVRGSGNATGVALVEVYSLQ